MTRVLRTVSLVAVALTLIGWSGCSGGSDTGGTPPPAADSGSAPPARPAPQPSSAPAPTGAGVITGSIRYEGDVPKLSPLKMDADPGCAKKHSSAVMPEILVLGADNALANVLVRIKGGLPGGSYPTPTEPAVLDQSGCRYLPHVQGVMVGQEFKVLNSDNLLHNVHSLPKVNAPFNRAMPATVAEASYTFNKEEAPFKIKCDVHPWMNAWVGVFSHPYFSVTDDTGAYRIEGLPAGDYEIEAWHERLGTRTAQVSVSDAEAGTADFTFTR